MKSDAHFFRIGLFVILGALLLAAALIVFGAGQMFRPRIQMVTYADGTVQGIEVGSPVKFRGVTVGKVQAIEFLFTEFPTLLGEGQENLVVIAMEIDKEVFPGMFDEPDLREVLQRSIDRGLRARIEPQGITGLNYIEVNYTDPKRFPPFVPTWKMTQYYIPSAPGELTSLLDSVNNIMREIEELNIKGISDGTVALLQNLNDTVTEAQIDKLSADAQKLFRELSSVVEKSDIPRLSKDAQKLLTDLSSAVDSANIPKLSSDSQNLVKEVGRSNEELRQILRNMEPALRFNGNDIAASLSNLKVITDNFRVVSGELARDPSSLFFSRPPKPASVFENKPPRRQ